MSRVCFANVTCLLRECHAPRQSLLRMRSAGKAKSHSLWTYTLGRRTSHAFVACVTCAHPAHKCCARHAHTKGYSVLLAIHVSSERLFRLCTRLQLVARVNYYNSFASLALIGCRPCSRDRMSLITMITHALCLEAF
jgi:hypothetical protein